MEQEDYARTRLTHSIEVMSVAGSLAVQATKIILDTNLEKYFSQDCHNTAIVRDSIKEIPTILNAAALLHDMGNPPFGHLGEQIISDWFRNNLPKIVKKSDGSFAFNDVGSADDTLACKLKGKYADDLMHFEGNAQLLRLVTKLMSTEQTPAFFAPPKHPLTPQKLAKGRTESYGDSVRGSTWQSHGRRFPAA